jgi:acyl-CoA thioester hydrolase
MIKKITFYKLEMIEKSSKKLSATLEMLSLYIDLNKRKVSEFEEEKVKLMNDFINLNKSNFKNDDLVITGKLKK